MTDIDHLRNKLRMHKAQCGLVANGPDTLASLWQLPQWHSPTTEGPAKYDHLLLFATHQQQLHQLMLQWMPCLVPTAIFWACYPKKSSRTDSDLHRDAVWQVFEQHGLRPVSSVAIDSVWTALRGRAAHLVGRG